MSEPPADPEILYQKCMAHYQRREWEAALECFARLRELQPERQGLDDLLDEISWFLQLEAVEDEATAPADEAETTAVAERHRLRPRPWPQPVTRRRRLIWLVVPLAVLLAAAIYLLQFNGFSLLAGLRLQTQIEELRNRGQARLAVGDYEGAIDAFQELVTLVPDDEGSQMGLERARRLNEMAARYAQAKEAVENESWEEAQAHLREILAQDENYADAQQLLDSVERHQHLLALYEEGVQLYDLADWQGSLEKFEQIRSLAPGYRTEAIQEFLFVSYLSDGQLQLAEAGNSLEAAGLAAQRFGSALSIHPKNQQASEERRLISLYLEGLTSYQRQDWQQAQTWLEGVCEARPDYAGGHLALVLCEVYLSLGDERLGDSNYEAALGYYQAALALEHIDCSDAQAGEQAVLLALATPTPTSTATATPTPTPLPTATPTATPSPLPTSTPTPTPTATPSPTVPPPTSPPPTRTTVPTATPTLRPPTVTPTPPR